MPQTHGHQTPPTRSAPSADDHLTRHVTSATSSADAQFGSPVPPPIAAEPISMSGPRLRVCVLCGDPLRAGQHVLRIHGSTIHARCSHSTR